MDRLESPELYQWNRFLRYLNEIKRKHNDGNDSSVNSSDNENINITDDEEQDHIDTKPNHKKRKSKQRQKKNLKPMKRNWMKNCQLICANIDQEGLDSIYLLKIVQSGFMLMVF